MNKTKRIFVISWYYPPGNSSEGLVTFKLLKNSKYQYDVWTRNDQQQSVWDRKSDESKLTSENVKIIKDDCEDMQEWVEHGLEYFEKHSDDYDLIMSRSMPAESHELAIKIKERFPNIKWIASFGDPIVDTPYIDAITMGDQKKNPFKMKEYFYREQLSMARTPRVFLSPLRNARRFLWEHDKKLGEKAAESLKYINDTVLREADVLIYNNKYQFEHAFSKSARKKYKSKGRILEHSFDASMYPARKAAKKDSKLSFIYVGHLDDTRNAHSLLKAINHLKKKDPELNKRVEFDFYGHLGDRDKLYLLDHDLMDVVKIFKDVKYLDSLKIIKNADWAILIDANFTSLVNECIYLPAKLIDYIGARTKVFSISHVKGAGADIINEIGGGKVVTHSQDDIYLYLSKIIYQNYEPEPYDEKKTKKFSSEVMAKKLDAIEKELIEG